MKKIATSDAATASISDPYLGAILVGPLPSPRVPSYFCLLTRLTPISGRRDSATCKGASGTDQIYSLPDAYALLSECACDAQWPN